VRLCGKKDPFNHKGTQSKTQSYTKVKLKDYRLKIEDKNGNPEN